MDRDRQKEMTTCAACNHMHHKCPSNCIFAPYFPVTNPSFDYVYRVYGCSNVGKILQSLPVEQRRMAAESLAFEAEARIRDPVLGSVGYIYLLQQHLAQIDRDIQETEAQIISVGYQPPPLPPPLEQHWHQMPPLTTTIEPSYHEQPDDLLWLTGATSFPSMPRAEPIPQIPQSTSTLEILPIPSTPSLYDNLMTDAEIQVFLAELEEDLLSESPKTPSMIPQLDDQQNN